MPALLVTEILPDVAPVGTCALIVAPETTVNVATLPLIFTDVIPEKFEPVIVIVVCAVIVPDVGVNVLMIGIGSFMAGHPAI